MMSKKKKEIKLSELTPEEQLKYEVAEELGLLPRVLEEGWKSLSSKETGKIGGMVNQRKKKLNQEIR
ncbi:MAG: small, acid-soluble spore protein, alpha/beta type [Lachnospiraceae bacterium]|nr:small, acid-soluble spore protein, alpha/beta type [Lachnospiraceae bacterium]